MAFNSLQGKKGERILRESKLDLTVVFSFRFLRCFQLPTAKHRPDRIQDAKVSKLPFKQSTLKIQHENAALFLRLSLPRKRSFISTVRSTVHTNPTRKCSFSRTLFKPKEFENASFAFYCGRINKLTSVFYASVLLLLINFVITLSKQLRIHEAIGSADYFENVMTKFIVNNRTVFLR